MKEVRLRSEIRSAAGPSVNQDMKNDYWLPFGRPSDFLGLGPEMFLRFLEKALSKAYLEVLCGPGRIDKYKYLKNPD